MQEVKLTGVIIREDCSKSNAKSFSATGQCTQGEFKGYMHFSELQMDYCFTCATLSVRRATLCKDCVTL